MNGNPALTIGILASEGSWYYRDLERAAVSRCHQCVRLDFSRLVSNVSSTSQMVKGFSPNPDAASSRRDRSNPDLIEQSVSQFDVILVRSMPPGALEQVVYRMDVLARLEAGGTSIVNSPKSLECAIDKFLTTARLQAAGLPVPNTIVCEHEDDAMIAFEQLGRDVVIKPLFGSEGRGIVRVTDPDLAFRTFRTLMRTDAVLYLQQYVDHGGYDVRILVLGGQVVGGMKRHSPDDFRTNVAREAVARRHDPTPNEIELAIKAAVATGTTISGIDLLYDQSGNCHVIEVNAVPGWQAFSRVNEIDVAGRLIDHLSQTCHGARSE